SNSSCRSELGVCVPDQLNHFSSGLFLSFVVFFKLVLYVAISAVNAKRAFKSKHNLHQSIGGNASQELYVLVLLLCAFFFAACWKRVERRKLCRCSFLSFASSACDPRRAR